MDNNVEPTDPVKFPKIKMRRSLLAELPLLLLTIVSIILAVYFTIKHPGSIQHIELYEFDNWTLSLPIPFYAIIPVLLGVYLFHLMFDCIYVIGHDYVRSITGLISLTKIDNRIELNNLRGVDIHRNLYHRLVNVGTLRISSATHDNVEVSLYDIYNPSHYRDVILKRRHRARVDDAHELGMQYD